MSHSRWQDDEPGIVRARQSWHGMRRRCLTRNPEDRHYKLYRARGITVCARWDSFENFLADMGQRPEGLSLDRINNDGNYEPGNCRWATQAMQCANRRNLHPGQILITHEGVTQPISAWAKQIGVRYQTMWNRLTKWGVARAVTTPAQVQFRSGTYGT